MGGASHFRSKYWQCHARKKNNRNLKNMQSTFESLDLLYTSHHSLSCTGLQLQPFSVKGELLLVGVFCGFFLRHIWHIHCREAYLFFSAALSISPLCPLLISWCFFFPHICSFILPPIPCFGACSGLNYKEMIDSIRCRYKNVSSCILKAWLQMWKVFFHI